MDEQNKTNQEAQNNKETKTRSRTQRELIRCFGKRNTEKRLHH